MKEGKRGRLEKERKKHRQKRNKEGRKETTEGAQMSLKYTFHMIMMRGIKSKIFLIFLLNVFQEYT